MIDDSLVLRNRLKEIRKEQRLSQDELAKMVGVSRNTISSIETGQFNPTAKLALILCIALDKKFEDIFYFNWFFWTPPRRSLHTVSCFSSVGGGTSRCKKFPNLVMSLSYLDFILLKLVELYIQFYKKMNK